MSAAHIAGPWVFEPHGAFGSDLLGEDWPLGYISQSTPRMPIFVLGHILELPTEELLASAQLAALAPELLEALKRARHTIAVMADCLSPEVTDALVGEPLIEIDAVIAKTRGEA